MEYVKWFEELRRTHIGIAGGKGANLGEMTSAGFPIPPGFVVTSNAYFKHLEHNELTNLIKDILVDLDVNDTKMLESASQRIKELIMSGEVPPDVRKEIVEAYKELCRREGKPTYVAVRSSATAEDLPEASFAGQQKTLLNVIGEGDVVEAVKEDWASLFEPRAIFYRAQKGFDHMRVGLAAVVQKMVESTASGVMFTVDPISEDESILTIEAGYGLGEYIVSGTITPDTYRVNKNTLEILSKDISTQTKKLIRVGDKNESVPVERDKQKNQKITDEQIKALAKYGIDIEKHYDFPQDIEWAIEGEKIFITQARPITTLKGKGKEKKKEKKEEKKEIGEAKMIVKGLPASPGVGMGVAKILKDASEIGKIESGDVLVAKMTTPDFVPAMKKASAIVTDEGGMTSHAAIVSRELGIPCIVGTGNATQVIQDGMEITVDGSGGIVYSGKVAVAVPTEEKPSLVSGVAPVITATKIYVNLAEPDLADKIAKLPVDGVGLLRAEFMIAGIGEHPKKMLEEGREQEFIDKLADGMRKFAAAFYPRPVVYRATDFKTNEYKNLKGGEKYEPEEANPMMGYRGAVRYIKEPELFKMELKAMKKVRDEFGLKNLWLMIPFVRRIGEIRAIKEILREVGIYRTRDFKLWIMVEVPSTVFLIDKFAEEGIDGVSIGTNDLTQLILGIDRDNATLGREFDERNDAVLRALKHVIKTCNKYKITVSLCGQAPSVYPEFAEKLVEFGITSISVNPDAVERTRNIVASAEKKIMLKKLSELSEHLAKQRENGY
ncbi:MAG: phosphoenolpyruvate synthase [Candidatus Anstonellales archaeon]